MALSNLRDGGLLNIEITLSAELNTAGNVLLCHDVWNEVHGVQEAILWLVACGT